ncbi:hypothetical protein V1512DRAFT_293179 [Lipomyces arxii]|uniref:uncharacterized protein n=1 Tax=Lipomyces arxii TaxID=56418 RepID=UPI0034D01C52
MSLEVAAAEPAEMETLIDDSAINIDESELLQADENSMEMDDKTPAELTETNSEKEPWELRPNAVLLSGVDHMSTTDVKLYAVTYFTEGNPPDVEWVDDTSVVLVYPTRAMATAALNAFTSEAEFYDSTPSEFGIRNAKVHPKNGKHALKVRHALDSDRKMKHSREQSRYYLLYGDPREENNDRYNPSSRNGGRYKEKEAYMDITDFSRERRRVRGGAGEKIDVRDNDEDKVDNFPSVLKGNFKPLSKSWANAGAVDRYAPDRYDEGRRYSRRRSQSPERRRRRYDSRSPEKSVSKGQGRDRDSGSEPKFDRDSRLSLALESPRSRRAPSNRSDLAQRINDGETSSRDLSSRIGSRDNKKVSDSHASDFGSRVSAGPREENSRGNRRRAHHLDFD